MKSLPTDDASRSYSPFWAILAVFVTLIFLQTTYVMGDFEQKSQIKAAGAQVKPQLTQAKTVNQTTEALGRDLVALSANSTEAAKIVAEFKIRLNAPAEAPKPAPAPAPTNSK